MRTARYRHNEDDFYPNVVTAASSDVAAAVSSGGSGGDGVKFRLQTYARLGLLYGSVFVSGTMLGAMITFFICTNTFAADVTRTAAAASRDDRDDNMRNLLRDCYDDGVVENDFYCSLNEDAARQCKNERTTNPPRTFPRISKTDRDDEIERLSFVDDYAYSTFGPAVEFTDSSENSVKRKIYDTRLRLARIACATKNLLLVLTATTA